MRMMQKFLTRLALGALALALVATLPVGAMAQAPASTPAVAPAPQPQVPQPDQGVNWSGAGIGAASILANVLYIPTKLVYALMGGIVGGFGYVVTGGNTQVANTIWRSSLGGDYALTPDMLTGAVPIHFSGPTSTAPVTTAVAPIAPVPPPASATPSVAPMAAIPAPSPAAGQPLDSGAGPAAGGGGLPATTIK